MIAAAKPSLSISRGAAAQEPLARLMMRVAPALMIALGFLAFTPYPAISIGRASAVQIGNVLSLFLLIPVLAMPWRYRPIYLYPLILAPLVLSAVKAGLTETGDVDLCFKTISAWVVAAATMVVVQMYAPRYALHVLTGIAAATLVHTAVGLWQVYCFSQNQFPFLALYVNQSFLSVQDYADVTARYVQRPFGVFPEPSAMASSLAPWIVFWVAELCGIVRLRDQPARWQRVLFAAAAAGGLVLIILSSSGHQVITLAAVLLIGLLWFRDLRATRRTVMIVLPVLGVLLPLMLWMAATIMSSRVDGEYQAGGSWDDRSTSLLVGLSLYAHGDLPTLLFGLGVGLSSPLVSSTAGLDAVWSVLLTYLYETGLAGILVVGAIGFYLFRVWRASELNAAFAAMTVVWVVGITLTTSYHQLLPIWVALGWLTVWPAICTTAKPEPARRHTLDLPRPQLLAAPDRRTWVSMAGSLKGADR